MRHYDGKGATPEYPPIDEEAGQATEAAVNRIAEEALTNVMRHAAARSVMITLGHEDGRPGVAVEDDGVGAALLSSVRREAR